MRAIVVHRHGGPEVLALEDVPLGAPGPGQARIRHTLIGVNFIDVYHRTGLYALELPATIGVEAAAVVEQVGEGVSEVRPGDRVAYAGGVPGAYAEGRLISAARLVPLPGDISDETAAAALQKGMTAEYLVRRTHAVKSGETVLFHAAAGGVGLIACQWLHAIGARVIGTVGSDEKAALARRHGCDETIVYTRENFVERVRELTSGKGVPVVYDSVGRTTVPGSLDCLSRRGLLVSFGNASGKPEPIDLTSLGPKGSLYVTRPVLDTYTAERDELLASAEAVFDMIRRGKIRINVSRRYPLKDAALAHAALQARETTGSVVLTLD
jgi:NADPH2:quinone reductase